MEQKPALLDHLVTTFYHPPGPPSRVTTTKMGSLKTSSPRSSKLPSPSTPIFRPSTAVSSPCCGGSCPHSDGTTPICWDCVEAGHPGATATVAASRQRTRSKASSLFSAGRRGSHNTLQVHPAEPGLEVCVSDYRHLHQPGLEVSTGPHVVDAAARYGGQESKPPLRWLCAADADSERNTRGASVPRTVCGVRRRWFVVTMLGVLLSVLAIILGVVFGVAMKGKGAGGTQGSPR